MFQMLPASPFLGNFGAIGMIGIHPTAARLLFPREPIQAVFNRFEDPLVSFPVGQIIVQQNPSRSAGGAG